jgi:hypothetical protein
MNEIMAVLSPILGDKIAEAIIAHRKAKKAPLTVYAAELQVREYIKTGNPIAAAEMQILRNWVAIKASWYFNEIEKEKREAEKHQPAIKTSADRFQSREEYLAYHAGKNSPEPVNDEMRARLRSAGIGV